jgi:hypothetical protein
MGKVDKRISIVLNMSEDRLRKLIREEVRAMLNETLDREAEKAMETIQGIPVTLGNPSTASYVSAVPFPELKAERVQERIEQLEREAKVGESWDLLGGEERDARILGYTLDELRGIVAFAISKGWGEGDAQDPG